MQFTDNEQTVLRILADPMGFSLSEIVEKTHLSLDVASNALDSLLAQGVIEDFGESYSRDGQTIPDVNYRLK